MNRICLFVLTLLLLLTNCKAQKDSSSHKPDRFVIGFSMGAVFPGSRFTKADLHPPKLGKSYKAEFMFLPFKYFGLICSYSKTINETEIPSGPVTENYPYSGMGNPNKSLTYMYWSGAWKTDNYCLDLVFQPNTKVDHVRVRAGGGFQEAITPPIHIYYPNGNYSRNTEGTKTVVFVFHAGLDARIKLVERVSFLLSQDIYDSVVGMPSTSAPQKNVIFVCMSAGFTYSIR